MSNFHTWRVVWGGGGGGGGWGRFNIFEHYTYKLNEPNYDRKAFELFKHDTSSMFHCLKFNKKFYFSNL